MNSLGLEKFQIIDANPGGTLQKFNDYIEQIELLFKLTFRKMMVVLLNHLMMIKSQCYCLKAEKI